MLQTTIRITNSIDVGITGLTGSNIKFRRSPFGAGDVITIGGVSGGTNGVYLCDFIGVPYQAAQLWIDDVYQNDWGTKYIGDIFEEFLSTDSTTTQSVASNISMTNKKILILAPGSNDTDAINYGQAGILARENIWTADNIYDIMPHIDTDSAEWVAGAPADESSFVWKKWIEDNFASTGGQAFGLNTNRIQVDSKLSVNITGKKYNTIQAAIAYASSQTPSATSKWEIYIVPHHSTGYAEDVTLVRFVELIGMGSAVITGTLDTTHPASQTWTGYDARIENLIFNTANEAVNIKNIKAKNCYFKVNGAAGEQNLIIDGVELNDCGLFIQNDVNLEVFNTIKINRIQGCYGNVDIPWLITDKVYSFDFVESDIWEL